MDWMQILQQAIATIELNILNPINAKTLAAQVHVSEPYLRNGFRMITGYTVTEYIRNRRLYLAATDILNDKEKLIDIAYKYGYETQESFSKAYCRFHGFTPSQTKEHLPDIKMFRPFELQFQLGGGDQMSYRIEHMNAFRLWGQIETFSKEGAYRKIPGIWKKFHQTYGSVLEHRNACTYGVGIGIKEPAAQFQYAFTLEETLADVSKEGQLIEIPAGVWAKFLCIGPNPGTIQTMNYRIFEEWLPYNSAYELAYDLNVDCNYPGHPWEVDYRSEIWIPIKKKEAGMHAEYEGQRSIE